MRYYTIEERVDLSEFTPSAKRFLKEIEYQIFDNPAWEDRERVWWNALRNAFMEYADERDISEQEAYMRGVEFANYSAGLDEAS